MSCIAGIYNITCDQGATLQKSISWTDSANNPYNLTGYSARMQVRATAASSTVLLELTTGNGRITVGSTEYNVNLLVSAAITDGLTPGLYVYDLEIVSPSGTVDRILEGNFKVKIGVTR
jgi:hypothetical protein